jgi:hypothetical protein
MGSYLDSWTFSEKLFCVKHKANKVAARKTVSRTLRPHFLAALAAVLVDHRLDDSAIQLAWSTLDALDRALYRVGRDDIRSANVGRVPLPNGAWEMKGTEVAEARAAEAQGRGLVDTPALIAFQILLSNKPHSWTAEALLDLAFHSLGIDWVDRLLLPRSVWQQYEELLARELVSAFEAGVAVAVAIEQVHREMERIARDSGKHELADLIKENQDAVANGVSALRRKKEISKCGLLTHFSLCSDGAVVRIVLRNMLPLSCAEVIPDAVYNELSDRVIRSLKVRVYSPDEHFQIGDVVAHSKFREGRVMHVGEGRATIDFAGGSRTLRTAATRD